jgi:hypothetical protein
VIFSVANFCEGRPFELAKSLLWAFRELSTFSGSEVVRLEGYFDQNLEAASLADTMLSLSCEQEGLTGWSSQGVCRKSPDAKGKIRQIEIGSELRFCATPFPKRSIALT